LPSTLLSDCPEDDNGDPAQSRPQPRRQAKSTRRRIGGRADYDTYWKSPAKALSAGDIRPSGVL
jgi:hypothetical protein